MALSGDVALIAVGIVALWLGARWLVAGASRLARSAGVSALVVGLTVVAFGTSAPEVVVSSGAAFEGRADVAVGNVVGSNVFNLGIILGTVAVLAPFRVTETLLRRDALAMAAATAVGIVVLADRTVSRLEGAVLVAALVGYLAALAVAVRRANGGREPDGGGTGVVADVSLADADAGTERPTARPGRDLLRVLVGLALVGGGGRALVDGATAVALSAGVSEWLVGVTVVAAGTSLPELVTSVVAIRRGHVSIAAGNVVGSNVFNLLGVLGLAAVIRPMTVDPAVFVGLAWLGVVTAGATAVLATGRRLTRLEGVALVGLGFGYWIATAIG